MSDLHVMAHIRPPLRQTSIREYVKTDKGWLVELRFNSDVELALFERFLRDTPVRLTEYRSINDEEIRYFVVDDRISNDATWDDIWKWVKEELPRINAAIAVHFPVFFPPTCRCVVELKADGTSVACPPSIYTMQVGMEGMPRVQSLLSDNSPALTPFLAKAQGDKDFSEALMLAGQALAFRSENPWAKLYSAFEVVDDRFKGHGGIVRELGCGSNAQIDKFKRTCNHQEAIGAFSRHRRSRVKPPPDPMSFDEAREFVLSLLNAWGASGL